MLKLRIEQSVGRAAAAGARTSAAAGQIDGGAQPEAALAATGRCHPPSGAADSDQHNANSCRETHTQREKVELVGKSKAKQKKNMTQNRRPIKFPPI